jgi:hypothetical protein
VEVAMRAVSRYGCSRAKPLSAAKKKSTALFGIQAHLIEALRCGGILLLSLCLCSCFSVFNCTLAQEPNDLLAAWAEQAQHELANPPERGVTQLGAVSAVQGLSLPALTFNRYLSLLITDVDTVNQISFSDLMNHLAIQTNDASFSEEMLFHQWWDTQNQRPGLGLQYVIADLQDFLSLPSTKIPPKIGPVNIIDRLRTQTCAGWPSV